MCGEAAAAEELIIVLFLTKTRKEGAMPITHVLRRLKFWRYVEPSEPCPHYAGPVYICATEALLNEGHTDFVDEGEMELISLAMNWQIGDFRTPNDNATSDQIICLLKDQAEVPLGEWFPSQTINKSEEF